MELFRKKVGAGAEWLNDCMFCYDKVYKQQPVNNNQFVPSVAEWI